jgi:hypothetical protein
MLHKIGRFKTSDNDVQISENIVYDFNLILESFSGAYSGRGFGDQNNLFRKNYFNLLGFLSKITQTSS